MSNRTIDNVLRQLRLLARANVVCDQYGKHLRGEINQVVEDLRVMLSDAYDSVVSINEMSEEALQLLQMGATLCSANRDVIRELESEIN